MPRRKPKNSVNCAAAIASAALLVSAGQANAAPVDLSDWVQDGNGSWSLQDGNNTAFQASNSPPTVFHNDTDSQGNSLAGQITVETTSDDDFIGFVLGYTQGDIDGNTDTDYILIDWKQGTQSGWEAGLSISRVTGPIQAGGTDTGADAWQHKGNVELLARANTLGSTGWLDNTTYDFKLDFTSEVIRVFVNDVLELEVFGTFANGAFGFYNFSQPSVRYAGITSEVIPPSEIPIPGTLALMLTGFGGLGGLRVFKRLRAGKA